MERPLATKPAVEARLLLEDPRYESYRADLQEKRDKAERLLLRRGQLFETMCRLAGEISAYDHALGLPAELLATDPESQTP